MAIRGLTANEIDVSKRAQVRILSSPPYTITPERASLHGIHLLAEAQVSAG